MKILISKGMVVFAGIAGISGAVAQTDSAPVDKAQVQTKEDPRIRSVRNFFQRHHSPAQKLSDVFVREADNNGLDWRLLPGLALIETGGGKNCRLHNLFGWKNGKASFSSFSDGIRQVAWHLSNSHFYRNKSLDGVLLTYNKDPEYRKKVKSVMNLISPRTDLTLVAE